MAAPRHLTRAPIKEAIIDVQGTALGSIEEIESIGRRLKPDYPEAQKIVEREFGFEVSPGQSVTTRAVDKGVSGFRVSSGDGRYVAQIKLNGFTLSRLVPYESWEQLKAEAQRLWPLYAEGSKIEVISRIAVRYINVLEIPLPVGDFAEYLGIPPAIPSSLPQAMSSFLMRYVLHDVETAAVAIVTQALQDPVPNKLPVVLDIDTFMERDYKGNDPTLWADLEKLRRLKNRIFFEAITEKTASLFQ